MCERKVQFHNLHFRVRCANGVSDASCVWVSWITSLLALAWWPFRSPEIPSNRKGEATRQQTATMKKWLIIKRLPSSFAFCLSRALLFSCLVCVCMWASLSHLLLRAATLLGMTRTVRAHLITFQLFRIFAAKLSPSLSRRVMGMRYQTINKNLCRCFWHWLCNCEMQKQLISL